MDLKNVELFNDFCKQGDLENVKKFCLKNKLTKKDICGEDYKIRAFDYAYQRGHLEICKFFIGMFNITKTDILLYKKFYFDFAFNCFLSPHSIQIKYVNFLINDMGLTEEDVQDYFKSVPKEKIFELFTPLGSLTKSAQM